MKRLYNGTICITFVLPDTRVLLHRWRRPGGPQSWSVTREFITSAEEDQRKATLRLMKGIWNIDGTRSEAGTLLLEKPIDLKDGPAYPCIFYAKTPFRLFCYATESYRAVAWDQLFSDILTKTAYAPEGEGEHTSTAMHCAALLNEKGYFDL